MKTEKIPILIGFILIVLLAFLIVWRAGILGVSEGRIEQDARESQRIESDWEVAKDINEDICAMLFYNEDKDDHTYSIYLTREGVSYGYFFRQGGGDPYIAKGDVRGIVFENKGIVLMSLNKDKASKIVAESGEDERVIQVDPEEPFVVVLPIESGAITVYDAQDNIVALYDTYTGV